MSQKTGVFDINLVLGQARSDVNRVEGRVSEAEKAPELTPDMKTLIEECIPDAEHLISKLEDLIRRMKALVRQDEKQE